MESTEANTVLVFLQGRRVDVDRSRFPGAQLWDLALFAGGKVDVRPERDWEYVDGDGDLHGWDEQVTAFGHAELHVLPLRGEGA